MYIIKRNISKLLKKYPESFDEVRGEIHLSRPQAIQRSSYENTQAIFFFTFSKAKHS